MDSSPIVHIGYHKTASTWFQQVFYPAVTNRTYIPREKVYEAFATPDAFAFDPERARRVLGATSGAILCEEELSGYLHNGGLSGFASREIAARIKATLPDAQIVIFVRAQPAMAAASYLQYIRAGGTHRADRYLMPWRHLKGAASDPYKAPRFALQHLAYDRLAEHYAGLFGLSRVHLFTYEEMAADPARFVGRFAERFDLRADSRALSMARRNVSYGRVALHAARLLNHFTRRAVIDKHHLFHVPGLYSARRTILEWANRLPGGPLTPEQVLGRTLSADIAERFRESNARLAGGFGLDLGAAGYPMPRPPVGLPKATDGPSVMPDEAVVPGSSCCWNSLMGPLRPYIFTSPSSSPSQ